MSWTPAVQGPSLSRLSSDSFAFDPAVGRCVGTDSSSSSGGTFEFGVVQAVASVSSFGSACLNASTGYLNIHSPDPLYLGEPGLVRLHVNLVQAPIAVLMGASRQKWNGTPLPLDLTAFGAPGCHLLVSPDVIVNLGLGSYDLAPSLRLVPPLDPAFAGFDLQCQAVGIDPTANAAGLVLSAGIRLRLGLR